MAPVQILCNGPNMQRLGLGREVRRGSDKYPEAEHPELGGLLDERMQVVVAPRKT